MSAEQRLDLPPLRSIDELEQLNAIDLLAERYHAEVGALPLNVSHWNSSAEFRAKLMRTLRLTSEPDPLSYVFSEELGFHRAVLEKLGFDPDVSACVIVPNGTIATLCAANWVASAGHGEMIAVCPNYFATLQQGRLLNLQVTARPMSRSDRRYTLPAGVAEAPYMPTPVFVTHPVYCTGVPLSGDDVQKLSLLLENGGTVMVDECVAWPGTEVGPRLARHRGFMGIYSPHKSVAMNGLKFSALVFDRRYLQFFQQWTDVIHGGLSVSNITAVKHFLSANFAEYLQAFRLEVARTLNFVSDLVAQHPDADIDEDVTGLFVTIYIAGIPADFDRDTAFFERMIRTTAGTVIPGRRSHFDPSVGACFRVNLTGDCAQFRATLVRLVRHLTSPAERAHWGGTRTAGG